MYESIQSSIVEPACVESLSIASGKFCENHQRYMHVPVTAAITRFNHNPCYVHCVEYRNHSAIFTYKLCCIAKDTCMFLLQLQLHVLTIIRVTLRRIQKPFRRKSTFCKFKYTILSKLRVQRKSVLQALYSDYSE